MNYLNRAKIVDADNMNRPQFLLIISAILFAIIIARLFYLQIIEKNNFLEKAKAQHEFTQGLQAKRGEIFLTSENQTKYPLAMNKTYLLLYAVPKLIQDASSTSETLSEILNLERDIIFQRLSKKDDIYEPIKSKLTDIEIEKVKNLNINGLDFIKETYRFYPDGELGGQLTGFVGYRNDKLVGNYGLEGYWEDILRGSGATLKGEKDAYGNFITIGDLEMRDVKDGSDLYLTIDQSIQHFSCGVIKEGVKEFSAVSGSVIVVNPKNGDVLAMCNYPGFDPNNYAKSDPKSYVNDIIFTAYEPGSVFKAITMSMGLDLGLVEPESKYTDTGALKVDGYTIKNSDGKSNGVQTMIEVLDKSLNTGSAFVGDLVGRERFLNYSKNFGFGKKTGIELNTEVAGNFSNLDKKGKIFLTTASFGQGITATPIQLAMAYSSLANGGYLYKPRLIKRIVYFDGTQEETPTLMQKKVISESTSKKISAMLVSVVENGHSKPAKIDNYYVAGKTGTAQVAEGGVYLKNRTIHTFAGYGPSRDPRFTIIVKYDSPQREWAESTSARTFKKIAEFIIDYYKLAPER
ncbi:MAG: penicillin-binding protein 2 [Patescibacteria group bacterium]|nr:penicillin-binding protein 2 [Patescibacteria group bacterium]